MKLTFAAIIAAVSLSACSLPPASPNQRMRAYQQAFMPERIDQILTRPQALPAPAAADRRMAGRTGAQEPRARMGRVPEDAPRSFTSHPSPFRVGQAVTVRGRVIASSQTRSGQVQEVAVWDGRHEFTINSPVARRQLAQNLGRNVTLHGRVVGSNLGTTSLQVDRIQPAAERQR